MSVKPNPSLKAKKGNPPEARRTKVNALIELLSRSSGATIEEMMKATGWQAHSVRGALAGAIKKHGHSIASEKHDGIRRYRIA